MDCDHRIHFDPPTNSYRCACGQQIVSLSELQTRRRQIIVPDYVGRLTDEGFYPARVTSGREKMTC